MVLNNTLSINTSGQVYSKYGGQLYFDDISSVIWAEYLEDLNILVCSTGTNNISWYELSDTAFNLKASTNVINGHNRPSVAIGDNGKVFVTSRDASYIYVKGYDIAGTKILDKSVYPNNGQSIIFSSVAYDEKNNKVIVESRTYSKSDYSYNYNGSYYSSYAGQNLEFAEGCISWVIDIATGTITKSLSLSDIQGHFSSPHYFSCTDYLSKNYNVHSPNMVYSKHIGKMISITDMMVSNKVSSGTVSSEAPSTNTNSHGLPKLCVYDPYNKADLKIIPLSKYDGITHPRSDYYRGAWLYMNPTSLDIYPSDLPYYTGIKIAPKSGNVFIWNTKEVFKLSANCETILARYAFNARTSSVDVYPNVMINRVTEEIAIQWLNKSVILNPDLTLKVNNPVGLESMVAFLPGLNESSSNEVLPASITWPVDNSLLQDTTPTLIFKVGANPLGWTQQFRVVADRDLTKLRSGSALTVYERAFDSFNTGTFFIDATWEYSTDHNPNDHVNPMNGTWTSLPNGEGKQKNGVHLTNGIDSNQGTYYVRMTVPSDMELTGADVGNIWEFKVYSYSKYIA